MKAFVLDNIDVATLMKALDECKGNVILLTDEGDRFNLKSKLSQMTEAYRGRYRMQCKDLLL